MQDFTKLAVWQKATALTFAVEKAFRRRTSASIPGLRNQILRAAASIPSNIAEGCGKATVAELLRYLTIALGSANELKSHLVLARGLRIVDEEEYARLEEARAEVGRMLWGLIRTIRARNGLESR